MVHKRLKGLRAEYGYTQLELAKKIDITTYSYAQKENGKTYFTEREINLILNIFDRKYEDIFMPKKFTKSK